MAGIDKIYLTEKQYYEFKDWCQEHENEVLKKLQRNVLDYFYNIKEFIPQGNLYPATNFPENIDKWLMKNCPFSYIQDTLKFQYGDKYNGK